MAGIHAGFSFDELHMMNMSQFIHLTDIAAENLVSTPESGENARTEAREATQADIDAFFG